MLGLGLGVDKSRGGFGKFQYLSGLPSFVPSEYSLAFDASGAETLNDYEANTLYFRDSNFNRVGATFSRTTTATRVNKQGLIETVAANVPRIDYTDGSAKLLMEPSRTNAFPYSEDFSNVAWNKLFSTVTGGFSDPYGGDNAFLLESDGSSTSIRLLDGVSISAGDYTFSFFAKAATERFCYLEFSAFVGASGGTAYFDLINGTTPTVGASIVNYGNGWYRCSLTNTIDAGDTIGNPTIRAVPSTTQSVYSSALEADGKSIYIFGAQLEVGSYPTSYIPTAGSTVTRNADVASNSSATSYIGQTEGTLYCDFTFNAEGDVFVITDGLNSIVNYVGVFRSSTNLLFRIRYNSSNNINFTTPYTIGQRYKIAIAYKSGDSAAFVNGLQVGTTDTTAFSFTASLSHFEFLNRLYYVSPTIGLNDYDNVSFFPTRLTNAELAQLTS